MLFKSPYRYYKSHKWNIILKGDSIGAGIVAYLSRNDEDVELDDVDEPHGTNFNDKKLTGVTLVQEFPSNSSGGVINQAFNQSETTF